MINILYDVFFFLFLILLNFPVNAYTVTTYTGDIRYAGTDANVHITLFGDKGDSGQKTLDTRKNNFERGKKDTFSVECPHLGKLKKIRIGMFRY